jgi:hypothetical protein
MMSQFMPAEAWFVVSTLLAPTGYVVQDVVADAMTVEAVPILDERGAPYPDAEIKLMHTTMQTLGRFAIVGGLIAVAALNIAMFSGIENMSAADRASVYADIYLLALIIPVISITGVVLGDTSLRWRARRLRRQGLDETEIESMLFEPLEETVPNWWILGGSAVFVAFILSMGLGQAPFAQEIVFLGSMAIVLFLMYRLVLELDPGVRRALVGTAVIIFVFRSVPLPGPGATWFEIDVLEFDQRFISVLSLITSVLALAGMLILRPLMANRSIAYIVVLLTLAAGILSLPNIGLYYGLHDWTAHWTNGIVDARFIAILDTAVESPLGQISMIPLLAWIAKNAPPPLKATFFAVFASFTNLALSASSLATKYLNQILIVTREVRDHMTHAIKVAADYSELGWLLITVALVGVVLPLITVLIIQRSSLRTQQ